MSREPFEPIAAQLGATGVDWVIDRLRRFAPLIGRPTKGGDDSYHRAAFECALYLEHWLMIEVMVYDKIGEDHPTFIEDVSTGLHELLPQIKEYIRQPRKGGPTPDSRRHVCASVCSGIWREFHHTAGSNSDALLGACEAYWQACGQPPTAADLSGNLRNWKRFLTSNSSEKAEVR